MSRLRLEQEVANTLQIIIQIIRLLAVILGSHVVRIYSKQPIN